MTGWLVLCLIWGSTWFVIKVGLTDLSPLSFAAVRFLIGSFLLFAVCVIRRAAVCPERRGDYAFFAVTGVLTFTINYGLLFWGEQRVPSGLAAILQATIPGFGLIFAHFMVPAEPIRWFRLVGVALGLCGVAAICSNMLNLEGGAVLRGGLALIVGAASTALGNVLIKSRRTRFDPAMMAAWQMLFGLIPLGILGVITEGSPFAMHWTKRSFACLLYLSVIGSCVAFCLFYWLINRISVTNLQTIPLITPVLAVMLGSFAGGEKLSGFTLLGSLFVLSGVALTIRRPRRMPAAPLHRYLRHIVSGHPGTTSTPY